MIEVLRDACGKFFWRWITHTSAVLLTSEPIFDTDVAAHDAAIGYRTNFWRVAAEIDAY